LELIDDHEQVPLGGAWIRQTKDQVYKAADGLGIGGEIAARLTEVHEHREGVTSRSG
jgi:hypothetical protein